ncbi:hypothetical protein J8I01_03395 [Aeromonas sanarellii]|uniref:Molybdopterin-binding oxidoreductase n=1 Tax=Aeromonas sanarellii TaxID=633415 RepID=A0ABS4B3X7_9GAMM|nr:hypothetical protein [Aeromonas sanarellii]MBP0601565.1 hypothetical protein [Aeromonas sanarellii]
MDIRKFGFISLLLVLISFGTQAATPLLQLILPDKREVTLDEAALAALPQVEFETATPWTVGVHRYRGPTLVSVLATQGAAGASVLDVVALNGYRQRVDLSLFTKVPLTLVRHQDGKPLTRRNKGPLWLLIPLSAHPEMDVSAIHNNMVWQTIRIEVVK